MKPPNITPPPQSASNAMEQQLSSKQQLPISATIIPSQHQQLGSNDVAAGAVPSTTAVPTTSSSDINNTAQPNSSSIPIVASQPTIITKQTLNSSIVATPVPTTATSAVVPTTTSIPLSTINVSQEQQVPLALTTQNQNRASIHMMPPTTTNQIHIQQLPAYQQSTTQIVSITSSSSSPITTQCNLSSQLSQLPHNKPTHVQVNTAISTASPITLATAPTTTGPTALVIIPQHSTGMPMTPSKVGAITSKANQLPNTLATSTTHVALSNSAQTSTIQMQAPVTSIVPTITQVPITAHQNTTLVNRPPQTLPVVPIAVASTINIKNEPNRNTCCLFDNGTRCDRVAGNASFSARIQKIVGTKKMNFALDQSAKHSYICDHHKAIITVAKKSTAVARDTKANARNYAANNNPNTPIVSQHTNNFNDINVSHPTLQHQMNIEMLSNQSRLANNHATVLNSIPIRPGTQIAYYADSHTNQMVPMDTINLKYSTGGDSVPSGSGGVDVDLQQLQVNTLRRYKRHFRVQTRPGLNKLQLAESLKHHFRTLPIIEKEAITYFVYIVKCHRNKLDHDKTKPE